MVNKQELQLLKDEIEELKRRVLRLELEPKMQCGYYYTTTAQPVVEPMNKHLPFMELN